MLDDAGDNGEGTRPPLDYVPYDPTPTEDMMSLVLKVAIILGAAAILAWIVIHSLDFRAT